MKQIILLIALIMVPWTVSADTYLETASGVDAWDMSAIADTISIGTNAIMLTGGGSGSGLYATGSTGYGFSTNASRNRPEPDTTTHFVCGRDTLYTLDRKICDTLFVPKDHGYRLEISCDSIYVRDIRDRWCKYITPKLDSTMYEKLMELIK